MSANPIQHKHFHLGITRHELHNHIPATGTGIQIRIQHNGAGSLTPGQSRGQILQNFELRVHVAPPAILAIHLIPLIHAQDLEFCLPPLRPRRNVPNLIRNFLRKHLQIMNAAVREIFRFGLAGISTIAQAKFLRDRYSSGSFARKCSIRECSIRSLRPSIFRISSTRVDALELEQPSPLNISNAITPATIQYLRDFIGRTSILLRTPIRQATNRPFFILALPDPQI